MAAASITLHKFGVVPEEEDHQVFTFIFDNPKKLLDVKSVESNEVSYGGHRWTLVCMRKEERYMGIFLKWKYTDGPSTAAVSCKAKYELTLIHRHDYMRNKVFHSTQKFSSAQSLLGKSKFVAMDSLLELGDGFLDNTGKRVVLELSFTRCNTRYEKTIDTSPSSRTRKNASGYYFDTNTFVLANQKWYLRVYPEKANANGLPAVYLYLSTKSLGISIELNFLLNIGDDSTEILTYNFGEGAKFDGFGKTLPEPLYNVAKMASLTIGVEISSLVLYKIASVRLRTAGVYAPPVYKDYHSGSYRQSSYGNNYTGTSLAAADSFQDQDGNYWKTDLVKDSRKVTVVFDKGVHHFPHNKTKLLCWSAVLLSRDPDNARDLEMESEPLVGYFSNFIDDKGYLMTFPIEIGELEDQGNAYTDDSGELLLRLNLLTLQTIPVGLRAVPRFDYQIKHLLRAKQQLQDNVKSLEDMREMSASRASLSFLENGSREDRMHSENTSSISSGTHEKLAPMYKSYDSLDALSTGDMMVNDDDDSGRLFYCDLLRHLARTSTTENGHSKDTGYVCTGRESYHCTREDVSTESGVTVSDESSLLMEARPSPVDTGKQKEIVSILVKFLTQRLPLRISEVLEGGSLGTGTGTRSRTDVDLVLYSPDLPNNNQNIWMPSLLQSVHNFVKHAAANPDPFYPLPQCSDFMLTPCAVQFNCGGLDVDIMLSFDWDSQEGTGYVGLYAASLKQTIPRDRQWCSFASAKLQKKFIVEQPNEVKEIIKVTKHWRNCVQWKKKSYRPNSYLLTLLVVKAVEETKSFDMKRVLQKVGNYVLEPELSLSWGVYYVPEKYPVEFEPPTPLVRDPANPGLNVAETLAYWGQFRSEIVIWLKSLNISVNSLGIFT